MTERGNTTTTNINAPGINAQNIAIKTYPDNDQTPGLTAYALQGRGQNGSIYQWNLYTAAIGGGYGVRPNAFEIWEYPESQNNGCCLQRFVIDKSRNATRPISAVIVDQNGGLALGGYGDAGMNALAVNGAVGIGTVDTKGYKLAVAGNVIAESVKVALQGNWPDYVFNSQYKLKSLSDVEQFIKQNKHLPEIPSDAQVKKEGINLSEMDAKLLQKIEELTLHLIEQDKKLKKQEQLIGLLVKNAGLTGN